ncbi:histidine utilization repressor [Thalassotalea mangrovi]|uniref:Histidine utilization repressor n=1 Tax=Thalassotalea mangrovi TaxID=2572245 RepID=A0A4U1B1L4_9GAMM|nr:histidine utilization repressor [Thalassotalea mangrovi]TKB43286.1 histidine utilization repressor [Thalassotalea mangrovi]
MSTPKFTQIKDHIRAQIESGELPELARVASENELAEQFQVSRMTARRALQELTEEGVLSRSKGAGTFVASFKSQSSVLQIRSIKDEINENGGIYSAQLLQLDSVPADDEIAKNLQIKAGSKVFQSVVLHRNNGLPVQLEQRFVNASLLPAYGEQDFSKLTPHEYLSQEAPLTEASQEIAAVVAKDSVCEHLQTPEQTACLQIKRRTWSRAGVVSFAILTSPGDRYRLGGHSVFN